MAFLGLLLRTLSFSLLFRSVKPKWIYSNQSLPSLLDALNPRLSDSLIKLRADRAAHSTQVTDDVNPLSPEVFSDFDADKYTVDSAEAFGYSKEMNCQPPTSISLPTPLSLSAIMEVDNN